MNRAVLRAVPLALLMIGVIVPMGRADRFAVDVAPPWRVMDTQLAPADTVDGIAVHSMSPRGTWLFGTDKTVPELPRCIWHVATWERTCIDAKPGEAVGLSSDPAWAADDSMFVVATTLPRDEQRGVVRLLLVEPATGSVSTLYTPEQGSAITGIASSPDGGRIAFIETPDDGRPRVLLVERSRGSVWTVVSASDRVTLADTVTLRWAADDHLVFYSGPRGSGMEGYWRVRADGSELTRMTAVTPGELEVRIADVSADGRLMIARGVDSTDACGPQDENPLPGAWPWVVVDVIADTRVQVICSRYDRNTPGGRGARVHPATTAAIGATEPRFLPDGSVLVRLSMVSGDLETVGLGVVTLDSGLLSVIVSDLPRYTDVWGVTTALNDGKALAWVGGYWRERLTLAPSS